jgi:hypothetical protein
MNACRSMLSVAVVLSLAAAVDLVASGRVGVYGIVEKVVFEPSEQSPQRVQVWGVFAYANTLGGGSDEGAVSSARRGYLYFKLPEPYDPTFETVKREWRDLTAVAGTGQAIGFGHWGYIGSFAGLDPNTRSGSPPYILEMYPGRGVQTDLRVRPASEPPTSPATYQTNAGIVRLSPQGSHANVVADLKRLVATR